jgi:hypothetical protein
MIGLAAAISIATQAACPSTDLRAEILATHEMARQAHLRGDAALIASATSDQLLLADNGAVRVQSKSEVSRYFTDYFKRLNYLEWRDVKPPFVAVSPDGQMAWMAVQLAARYTRADKPADGEKSFKSSWIATYKREECAWRMTGIASNIVD